MRLQSSLKEIDGLKDENELRTRHLRLLTETIPHMLWSATPDGMVDYVNQRVVEYAERPYQDFLGAGWTNTIHPDHVERLWEVWARSIATGEPFQFDFLWRHAPSGTWRWCVCSASPAKDAAGRIIKWYGSVVDFHDRKQAEDTRLQAERQYRSVVEAATDAVITIDATSTIRLVNPAVTKIFGYEPAELIGKPLTVLNGTVEVAGPEQFRFDELIRQGLGARNDAREVVVDPHARYFGAELNERSLIPAGTARLGGIHFQEWLNRPSAQR